MLSLCYWTLLLLGLTAPSDGVIPPQAAQNILDEINDLGLENIYAEPIGVYRLDLPEDYVAYFMVEAGVESATDYVLVTSGPETGDADIGTQGSLPSPISKLNDAAAVAGSACSKYILLDTDDNMICMDANGTIIATTFDEDILADIVASANYTDIHTYIMGRKHIYKAEWDAHRTFINSQNDQTKASGNIEVRPIRPGDSERIVVGDGVTKIIIRAADPAVQVKLCSAIENCSIKRNVGNIPVKHVETEPNTSIKKIALTMSNDTYTILNGTNAEFSLETFANKIEIVKDYFELDYPPQSKGWRYTSWSSYTIRYLPCPSQFPDYVKFYSGTCCSGKGPVAWAAIFAYYDRRTHSCDSGYGSKDLYTWGPQGWQLGYSNALKAPSSLNTRMRGYIWKIKSIMQTTCSCTTWSSKVDNVEGFFQQRQNTVPSHSPQIVKKITSTYSSSATNWVFAKAKAGWPMVTWMWVNGGWNTRVIIGYKYRTKKRRYCVFIIVAWSCGNWQTIYQRYMYVHKLNGSKAWYTMQSRKSWAAVY